MAVFVDLEDDEAEPPNEGQAAWPGNHRDPSKSNMNGAGASDGGKALAAPVRENPNRNTMTAALGCYPIVMAIAASIDLNTLDNLARTCRQVRADLLQYRPTLLVSTLHCVNEHLPVDPEETLRYRARAGNWYYMEDAARTGFGYNGKSGQCARDLVGECRRCGTVVCRNCAIKPPAPIVLRDRHRRLCRACTKAPLGCLVKPPLPPETLLSSEFMQRSICRCSSDGVWLCQPCGRTIRGDDSDYRAIWKWRIQYGEPLGGLGTGIGEGDRGVICGRENECCTARDCEQETDCDAEDARGAVLVVPPAHTGNAWAAGGDGTTINGHAPQPPLSITATPTPLGPLGATGTPAEVNGSNGSSNHNGSNGIGSRRTPSPALLGPGYERHEIEGIGGVVKTKLVRMVKVGACVPEWEDEKARGEILGREVRGQVRSWCGWCWRVIPGKKDEGCDDPAAAAEKRRLMLPSRHAELTRT